MMTNETLPALPLEEWEATRATLHMWTQVVGKIRLAQTPVVNHWWNVPLYLTARGLTTSAMPYADRTFQIDFDFVSHQLLIETSDGETRTLALEPRTVAGFYHETLALLVELGIKVKIWTTPVEIPDPIPFEQDTQHAAYDPDHAQRFWRILAWSAPVFEQFRSGFVGKCSPVHFFWGSFDLAVTRFSGRRAPAREGADAITREAYSHEVISHGFWPGSGNVPFPAYYSYAAPEPAGFQQAALRPTSAYYNKETGGYVLAYDDVRRADDPERALLDFMQTTYESGANLAGWDRASLERTT
ncbi:MAG: hypothetical protein QOE33_3545 [Acidobacteriota bacterium]|nr:hypothetical protein [Acidobacteriota bacterium]